MDDELKETLVSVAAAGPFAASVGETIVEPPANLAAEKLQLTPDTIPGAVSLPFVSRRKGGKQRMSFLSR